MATEPTPTDAELIEALEAEGVQFMCFRGGLSGTREIWTTSGSQDARKIAAGMRAAISRWGAQPARLEVDASGKPHIVRLAEDFAEDCIRAGYVTTNADSHRRLMDAARARPARADSVLEDAALIWAVPKYNHQQREWCIAYEAETGFDPMMDDYEAGLQTFAEAAVASLRWYEDHTRDAHLRISSKVIPGGAYDAARKQGGA